MISLSRFMSSLSDQFISEGDTFGYRWKWNETIGPLTDRPGRPGTWGYENTDGLGLVEYLHVCRFL